VFQGATGDCMDHYEREVLGLEELTSEKMGKAAAWAAAKAVAGARGRAS